MSKCSSRSIKWVNTVTNEVSEFRCNGGRCERESCRTCFCMKRIDILCKLITEYDLKTFFTLTLDRSLTREQAWDTIASTWLKMRKRLARVAKRTNQKFRFVAVLEKHKDGYPHIHGFCDAYIDKTEWSKHWYASGGGIHGSNVKGVTDTLNSGSYVTKELEVGKYVGKDNVLGALQYMKPRARTMWRSKGMKTARELEPKVTSDWKLVKGVIVNGKTYERKNMEATLQAVLGESFKGSKPRMEASKEACIGRAQSEGTTKEACSDKRRDQAFEELLNVCGKGRVMKQSKEIQQMIRLNIDNNLRRVYGETWYTEHTERLRAGGRDLPYSAIQSATANADSGSGNESSPGD